MSDITPVVELLTAYHPQFAQANYAPVRQWLAEGCDLHGDILPVLQAWTSRKPDIYSLGFFTPYVRKARQARLKAATEGITPKQRAERIAFRVRRLGQRLPTDERWLAAFEAEHGIVCGAETSDEKKRHEGQGTA